MYFLLQSNIKGDSDYEKIIQVLEEMGIAYETIELTNDTQTITTQADRADVFVYGSVKLARLAKANTQWYPGSFYGGNHLFEVYAKHYQGNLLNDQVEIFKLGDTIEWAPQETKFIKPYKEAKLFTGKVFTQMKWQDFVADAIANPKTPLLTTQSLVQASQPQTIIKEARLWIVGQQVVAGVYYRFHLDTGFEQEVASDGIEFAKRMINLFNVAEAFVMDICLTYDGWKIVEINCINSAGFYPNLPIKNLIKALHIYFTP